MLGDDADQKTSAYVPFSKAGAELLFDVVGRAYERTSLVVTASVSSRERVKPATTHERGTYAVLRHAGARHP